MLIHPQCQYMSHKNIPGDKFLYPILVHIAGIRTPSSISAEEFKVDVLKIEMVQSSLQLPVDSS